MPVTGEDIIKNALLEAGVYALGQALSGDDSVFMLGKFNKLLDQYNTAERLIFGHEFTQYTLVPNLAPHTIGPQASNPTYVVTQRPIKVISCSILDSSNPAVKISRLRIRNDAWWAAQSVPGLTSSLPTDLYYSPAFPLGKLYFWPTPTVAYAVLLETLALITQATLAMAFSMPPGYEEAFTLDLAVAACPPNARNPSALLLKRRDDALAKIEAINGAPPRMGSDLTVGGGGRGAWNFRTGEGS